jgi:hypothetical protein
VKRLPGLGCRAEGQQGEVSLSREAEQVLTDLIASKSYRDGLAIADRLAKSDPGNAGWQRDLSVSYNKIGGLLVAQGNLPEALKSFRDGHDIIDRLAVARGRVDGFFVA